MKIISVFRPLPTVTISSETSGETGRRDAVSAVLSANPELVCRRDREMFSLGYKVSVIS
jgi:hypothetical protein